MGIGDLKSGLTLWLFNITMEHHHVNSKIKYKWAIFNSYVKLPKGYGGFMIFDDDRKVILWSYEMVWSSKVGRLLEH